MEVVQSNPKKNDDIESQTGGQEQEYLPYHYEISEGAYKSEMTSNVPPPCCYKRKIGRMYVCAETSEGKPTCLFGACWPMTFVTWALISLPVIGVSFIVIPPMQNTIAQVICVLLTVTIVLIYSITLFCTGFSDPGIFKRHKDPVDGWTYHTSTNSYRPRGVVFCSESQLLVHDIDHFCPWTGTTIAKGNLKCFGVFVTMVCVGIMYLPALLIVGMAVGGFQRN
jgi:hypothetical protein